MEMKKIIYETSVEIKGDTIYISQPDFGDGADDIILSVDQVDIIIKWLKDAKDTIANGV